MDKIAIYRRLPIWGQNVACFYEGCRIQRTRYGKHFHKLLAEYEARDAFSFDRMREFRDARLHEMVKHCYETVPYYKRIFDEGGVDPDTIRSIEDLPRIPTLNKDMVKAHRDELLSSAIPERKRMIHATGGTTGAGLNYVTTQDEESEQWAVWWRYRRRLGMDFDKWCGNFGGKVTVDLAQNRPPFWRENRPCKQYFYSGYHINRDNAPAYAEHMKKVGLEWIHGYPSNLCNLAECLNSLGMTVPMKWVSIGAENLYDYQAAHIKKAFGCEIYQHYGMTEGVANFSQNVDGKLMIDEDYCCVEFLPSDEPGVYRIVGTTLTHRAMPLLRYETGDLAVVVDGDISGNCRAVAKINGRSAEFVRLPNGSLVGGAAIGMMINSFECISTMQIVQYAPDRIDVNVVSGVPQDQFPMEELQAALHRFLSEDMTCVVNFVNEVERTKNGKMRVVISKMEKDI